MSNERHPSMKDQTLKELRAQAKARGLKGYSRMSKDDLVRALSKAPVHKAPTAALRPERRTRAQRKTAAGTIGALASAAAVESPTLATASPAAPANQPIEAANVEEMVESAKYVTSPAHLSVTLPPVGDLVEDIDRLPELSEPVVCLLPQKPGILYAYWRTPHDESVPNNDYKLRLARSAAHTVEGYEEVPARAARGNWYFHLDENFGGGEMVLQLGYYRDGRFVTAQGQSVARLPSLYASARTDHRWWVSEQEFAAMYARAGGVVAPGRRYQWFASSGSPVGARSAPGPIAPTAPEKRMQWPGGVSSR